MTKDQKIGRIAKAIIGGNIDIAVRSASDGFYEVVDRTHDEPMVFGKFGDQKAATEVAERVKAWQTAERVLEALDEPEVAPEAPDTRDAMPGDIYVDGAGVLWLVMWTCDQPTLGMKPVEPGIVVGGQLCEQPERSGAVGSPIFDGFRRIHRPKKSEQAERG